MAAGSACPILARGTKPTLLSLAPRPACQYTCFLSVSGRKQGWRGLRLGWQWQIKPVTFYTPPFSFFAVFVAKPPPAALSSRCSCDRGTCFPLSRREYRGSVYLHPSELITPSSLSPSFSPLLSFPHLSVVSYSCGNVATLHWLSLLSDNTGGRRHSAVWLTSIKERRKEHVLCFFSPFFYFHYELVAKNIRSCGLLFCSFCLFWFSDLSFFNFSHCSCFAVFSKFRSVSVT